MAKTVSMTAEEIRKNYDVEKVITMAKSAPEEKELPFVPAPVAGRGFASFKEHINRSGRPLKENKKKQINLRIDSDIVEFFQNTGAGWQTRINESLRKVIQLREMLQSAPRQDFPQDPHAEAHRYQTKGS